jgi:hypothetical protein
VFATLDTAEFDACLRNWLRSLHKSMKGQGIAIDGKTLRRSFDTATGRAALHSVSAWAVGLRLSLGQVAVEEKSNEITAVPRLLELLEIAGAVVTLDAMHCQTETAAAIQAKRADYVLNVKANQPKLFGYSGFLVGHWWLAPRLPGFSEGWLRRSMTSKRKAVLTAGAARTARRH